MVFVYDAVPYGVGQYIAVVGNMAQERRGKPRNTKQEAINDARAIVRAWACEMGES